MIIIITQITESGQKGSHVGSGRPINLAIWQPGGHQPPASAGGGGQPHLIDRHEYLAQRILFTTFTTLPLISIICTPYISITYTPYLRIKTLTFDI